jgi:hypothetical protein
MTPVEIEELTKLESKATPAPWEVLLTWPTNDRLSLAARNALPHLLHERKLLIEALTKIFAMDDGDGFDMEDAACAMQEIAAVALIEAAKPRSIL